MLLTHCLTSPLCQGVESRDDALWDGDPSAQLRAIDDGADANNREGLAGSGMPNRTILMSAAAVGHVEVVKKLLAHGASIELQDANGNTALMHALMSAKIFANAAKVEVVKALNKAAEA